MNRIVSFLTLALMVFSVTLATYTLTNEALNGSNAGIMTVVFIDKNQVILPPVGLALLQPESNTRHIAFSMPNHPQNCSEQSINKTFTHIIPVIKTSRSM